MEVFLYCPDNSAPELKYSVFAVRVELKELNARLSFQAPWSCGPGPSSLCHATHASCVTESGGPRTGIYAPVSTFSRELVPPKGALIVLASQPLKTA